VASTQFLAGFLKGDQAVKAPLLASKRDRIAASRSRRVKLISCQRTKPVRAMRAQRTAIRAPGWTAPWTSPAMRGLNLRPA